MQVRVALAIFASCLGLACHDAAAPAPVTSRFFVLDSIDGKPVPAVFGTRFDTTIVVSSVLTLRSDGTATRVDQQRYQFGAYPMVDRSFTREMQYRIANDSITVGGFGACRDLCAPNDIGKYNGIELTLTTQIYPPDNPVYHYHIVGN